MTGSLVPAVAASNEMLCARHFRMDAESDAGGCALGDRSEDSGWESEGDDMFSNADSTMFEEVGEKTELSWARDRRELEASKLSFLRATRKQQQVDESVRLLLRKLEDLPCQSPVAKHELSYDYTKACESTPDRSLVDSSSELDPVQSGHEVTSPTSPTKKAARTCFDCHGSERHKQPTESKRCETQQLPPCPVRKDAASSGRGLDPQAGARPPPTAPFHIYAATRSQHTQQSSPEMTPQEPFEAVPSIVGSKVWSLSGSCSTGSLAVPQQGSHQAAIPKADMCGGQIGQSDWAVIGGMAKDPFASPLRKKMSREEPVPPSCESMVGSDPFSRWPVHHTPSSYTESHDQSVGPRAESRDQLLGPRHVMIGNDWQGWTMQTSGDGELFYYHEETRTSQWRTPRELICVLGEWLEALDGSGNTYWANDLLGMSCWSDPRCTANIFQAAYEGDRFFVQLYILGNGDLDVVDSSGCTALHYACASSSEDMAAYLLEKGASPDVPDLAGGRPLHWACRYSHVEATQLLLEARAHPDLQDSHGDSPLHLAAEVDCTGAVQHLVGARASPKLRTRKNGVACTSLEVAVAARAHGAASVLRDYEQELGWQSSQGPVGLPNFGSSIVGPAETCIDEQEETFTKVRPSPVTKRPYRASSSPYADEDVPSPVDVLSSVKVVARAAAPLLRGVQWLANRVIPMDDTRTKAWELGRGTPTLQTSSLSRLVAAIPRGALEQIVRDDQCFDDPPGFKPHGDSRHNNPFEHA